MNKFFYTNHAVKQMFQRNISTHEVEAIMQSGEIIQEYLDDKPLASKLLLGFSNQRPLHLVFSYDNENQTYIIITAYEPSLDIWEHDLKTRKK